MGTAERRIEIMKLLCRERHVTMPNLAIRFSVSVRTIKRDIDELGCTIPLIIKAGRYQGGVYVTEGYSWDKIYMSTEDISLLRTIKSVGEKRSKLVLDDSSLDRIEKMIFVYSIPKT